MSENTGRRDHLISFSCGDTLRYIQSEYVSGETYGNLPVSGWRQHFYQIQNNEHLSTMLDNDHLDNHYFMRDVTKSKSLNDIRFQKSDFSTDFLDFLLTSGIDNYDNSVYYDTDSLKFKDNANSMKKMFHDNDKCYIIKNNSYRNKSRNNHYELTQYDSNNEFENTLASYISKNYATDYYDKSHIVSDKSLPVYSIDENVLKNLHILRIENNDNILAFLKTIVPINSLSSILFNADRWEFDTVDFNAIYVDNLLTALTDNADYEKIFDRLLANVKYESFYRFLNPIGKIDYAIDEHSDDFEQYVYSPNLANNSLAIDTNYFTLKNLQNPNCEYVYVLKDIRNSKPIDSGHYDINSTNLSFKAVQYVKDVIDEFKTIVNQYSAMNSYSRWLLDAPDASTYNYAAYLVKEYGLHIFNPKYGYTTLRKSDAYSFFNERKEKYNELSMILSKRSDWKNNANTVTLLELDGLMNDISVEKTFGDKLSGIPLGLASTLLHNNDFEYINEYLEPYKDLYSHENEMAKDGSLFGYRTYVNGMRDDQGTSYLNYRYVSTYDEKFLKKITGISTIRLEYSDSKNMFDMTSKDLLNNMALKEILDKEDAAMVDYEIALCIIKTLYAFPNMLNAKANVDLNPIELLEQRAIAFENLANYEIVDIDVPSWNIHMKRISATDVIIYANSKDNEMRAFFKMIDMSCKFENVEAMAGSYYYKEKGRKRSNVFSLRFNNSGLEYDAMDYNECIDYIKGILNSSYDRASKEFILKDGTNVPLMKAMMICKIDRMLLDRSMVSYESNKLSEDSYTYIKYDSLSELEYLKKQIRTKSYLRRLLENSIRKNISKYIPVESTLWKIEYTKK